MQALQQTPQRCAPHSIDRFLQVHQPDAGVVHEELHLGLMSETPSISPKYLYDALGSRLFEAICELPEYYPTRSEAAILAANIAEIAHLVPTGTTLIDLGAGNCRKAAWLFDRINPVQYVPIDISIDFLRDAVRHLRLCHPHIHMVGIGMDFTSELTLPDEVRRDRRLFFYPGSSIGNFQPDEALAFLCRIREACMAEGGLLIGVDLLKDASILQAAYDDALGVTAAFNRNLLLHVNRVLGANFDLADWRHESLFNEKQSRVEMHLLARRDVVVRWQGGCRSFREGDGLHTENSYKYRPADFTGLLERAGFKQVRYWTDEAAHFMVCYAASS